MTVPVAHASDVDATATHGRRCVDQDTAAYTAWNDAVYTINVIERNCRRYHISVDISRLAVDMDIHGYIHGYFHVWISDLGHAVDRYIHEYLISVFNW